MAARLVNLYYAMGGGLGHLTRARAVLASLGVQARVLGSSPQAAVPGLFDDLDLLPIPAAARRNPEHFRAWLRELLQTLAPEILYLDSFPAGLFGELCDMPLPPGTRLHYLARLLDWDRYRPMLRGCPSALERAYLLEPLGGAQQAWLQNHASCIETLPLVYPVDAPTNDPGLLKHLAALDPPPWLVVHAGPRHEIQELLDYAADMARAEGCDPNLVLIAPATADPPPGPLHLPLYPARAAFPLAERIVTACGFNSMLETRPWRDRHRYQPMPRRFDDQYARARAARTCAEGLQEKNQDNGSEMRFAQE